MKKLEKIIELYRINGREINWKIIYGLLVGGGVIYCFHSEAWLFFIGRFTRDLSVNNDLDLVYFLSALLGIFFFQFFLVVILLMAVVSLIKSIKGFIVIRKNNMKD